MSDSSFGSPRCATLCTPYHTAHVATTPSILANSGWCIWFDPLSSTAVVMIGKGLQRQGESQNGSGLPTLTNPADHTKSTMSQGGSDPYQMLPGSVLAVRNPLVILDWSTNCYHGTDLARPPFYCAITKHYQPRC